MLALTVTMRPIWRSRSAWTFFGLSDEYIQNTYQQLFQLKYYGNWSFFEAYNLPVRMRIWFLQQIKEYKERENEQRQQARRKSGGARGKSYT